MLTSSEFTLKSILAYIFYFSSCTVTGKYAHERVDLQKKMTQVASV